MSATGKRNRQGPFILGTLLKVDPKLLDAAKADGRRDAISGVGFDADGFATVQEADAYAEGYQEFRFSG